MKAILLTGKTYILRRQIKQIGGRWVREETGWAVPVEKQEEASQIAKENDLTETEYEVDEDFFVPLEGEEKRKYLQEMRDRKAERLIDRAERKEVKAEEKLTKYKSYTEDYAFCTQPILVGHHSEKSHRKLKEKIHTSIDTGYELQKEAEELRSQAESLKHPVQIKGDRAKERLAKMENIKSKIKVGDEVGCWIFSLNGEQEIRKINKKTYRTANGSLRDIEFISTINGEKIKD